MTMSKKLLRSSLKKQLSQISLDSVTAYSATLLQRIIDSGLLNKVNTVALYLSMEKEVQTLPLVTHLLKSNKKLLIPKVTGKNSSDLIFVELQSLSDLEDPNKFVKNNWGIPEPLVSSNSIDKKEDTFACIDLVVVPGVAFDSGCNRLGHGKGYYDSFLSTLASVRKKVDKSPSITLGVGFDQQVVEKVPVTPHDVTLDFIFTPTRTFSSASN